MTCPFLKEAQVKYCATSSIRKLIPLAQAGRAEERCSSESYRECPVYRQQNDEGMAGFGKCPYLHDSLMQYCGAAAVAKFVPYSESLLSRCGTDGYRYCELYLQMAHPKPAPESADEIALAGGLGYSANHLWVDVGNGGICHAGIDAFLARFLGEVDGVSFVSREGRHYPAAVVSVAGADLEISLPFAWELTNCNVYLRANARRLTADPYNGGWLFEGRPDTAALDTLARGEQARHWMEEEVRKINEHLQHLPGPAGATAADGGMFSAGLPRCMEREPMFALFHEFFSPLREQEVRP